MSERYVLGVDFGGTKTAYGLYDQSCRLIAADQMETRPREGAEAVFRRMGTGIRALVKATGMDMEEIAAAGLCSPGPVDIEQGRIVYIASVGWRDVPAAALLRRELGMPVAFENDANAAALGERFYGAGRGLPEDAVFLYITVSTGVGCGVVAGGRALHGLHDSAGELGHLCLDPKGLLCSCGNRGCLEMYASGTAIARSFAGVLAEGGTMQAVTCRMAAEAAKAGDQGTIDIFEQAGQKLGLGIAALVQLLDPHRIAIGGGVSAAWELFAPAMLREAKAHVYQIFSANLPVVRAALGQQAGMTGAAALALRQSAQA